MVKENKKSKKHKRSDSKNKELKSNENAQKAEEHIMGENEDAEEQHEERDEINKRQHSDSDNDSDTDDKPKKKKKKNKLIPEQTGEKKGKKSIRQMKREKHAQRQAEAQAASKDQLKSQCLAYLSQWKHDKKNWKFMKIKQGWLFKNKFSSALVPDASWPLLLEYFESAKGNIRNLLLEDANKVIKQKDDWLETQNSKDNNEAINDENEDTETTEGPQKPDDTSYKRARDLLQCLQE